MKLGNRTPFHVKARSLVLHYIVDKAEKTDNVDVNLEDVYIVWASYTLGNWKCLVSSNLIDGMYYEVTHNEAKHETYVDVYKKWDNVRVKDIED